jgi:phosphoserine aminotransferase
MKMQKDEMRKPQNKCFSSGPCAKHRGWKLQDCRTAGRSHRSVVGIDLVREVTRLQREILRIPDDYHVGIVGGSASGAVECLLWSLLGARGADILSQCVFSRHWMHDMVNELKLADINVIEAVFPNLCDVNAIDFDNDVVFCMVSTTSGTAFQNVDWIDSARGGLTICDATSAAFIYDLDWKKLDATAFSWQKGLGAEGGWGTIVLSPRSIERLQTHKPTWPIPRIFRIAENKKVNLGVFDGYVINTPSMICLEDYRNNLLWARDLGGMPALMAKVDSNLAVLEQWVADQDIFTFLSSREIRAKHISCIDVSTPKYKSLSPNDRRSFLKKIVSMCEEEEVGYDFLGHICTPPLLRIWSGPTIEADDLEAFLPWLIYAYDKFNGTVL